MDKLSYFWQKKVVFFLIFAVFISQAFSGGKKDISPADVASLPSYPKVFNEIMVYSYQLHLEQKFQEEITALIFGLDDSSSLTYYEKLLSTQKVKFETENFLKLIAQLKELTENYFKSFDELEKLNVSDKWDFTKINILFEDIEILVLQIDSVAEEFKNLWEIEIQKGTAKNGDSISCAEHLISGTIQDTGIVNAVHSHFEHKKKSFTENLFLKTRETVLKTTNFLKNPEIVKQTGESNRQNAEENLFALYELLHPLYFLQNFNDFLSFKNARQKAQYVQCLDFLTLFVQKTRILISLLRETEYLTADLQEMPKNSLLADFMRKKNDEPWDNALKNAKDLNSYDEIISDILKEKWLNSLPKNVQGDTSSVLESAQLALNAYTELCSAFDKSVKSAKSANEERAKDLIVTAANEIYREDSETLETLFLLSPALKDKTDLSLQHPMQFYKESENLFSLLPLDIDAVQTAEKKNISKKNLEEVEKKLRALQKTCTEARKNALLFNREARASSVAVERLYNEAQILCDTEKYRDAHYKLNEALYNYTAENDSLRKDSDVQDALYQKIALLKQLITEKQRPLMVARLRELKTAAKKYYFDGKFDEAYSKTTEAKTELEDWAEFIDSEVEYDEELEKLSSLVETALSIKSGRELSQQDALYPEMSQLLSSAHLAFENAEVLLKQKKRAEAETELKNAQESLQKLKIVYPRNHEANILSLKIEQILSPNTFSENFSARVTELANADFSTGDSIAKQAYSDLLDLQEINPNYSGLNELIFNVEIKLGLRKLPVDNSSKEKAASLAAQALEALNEAGRDEILLQAVLSLADEALSLDSENEVASMVIDEIALRTGQESAIILSVEDEQKYQDALKFLQNGSAIEAHTLVQELLSEPKNRSSAKIRKLNDRIEGYLR